MLLSHLTVDWSRLYSFMYISNTRVVDEIGSHKLFDIVQTNELSKVSVFNYFITADTTSLRHDLCDRNVSRGRNILQNLNTIERQRNSLILVFSFTLFNINFWAGKLYRINNVICILRHLITYSYAITCVVIFHSASVCLFM